ncbi:MAG: glycosyltransferase [Burkholderiales bacterium]|nr:glycosyltransferase [Burkholderiales bacterium]
MPIKHFQRFLSAAHGLVAGRKPAEILRKALNLLRREGLAGLRRMLGDLHGISYAEWIKRYDTLSDEDRLAIARHVENFAYKPLISILVPVYNPPAEFLLRAISSVQRQLYPHWELCLADDASTLSHIRPILEKAAVSDPRIHVTFRDRNGHISAASNTALAMAHGEFIALLDHDDELTEDALYHVALALNENPALDLIYSDEDKIDAHGQRFGHYFKPDWNPDLFFGQNLITHLGVYRLGLARAIGGFREGYEGSQDWDFALRFLELTKPENIHHVPRVLYHWRAISGSTAISIEAKGYAAEAGRRSLASYWQKRGFEVFIEPVEAGHFHTHFSLPEPPPLVSILIPTRNRGDLLRRCIDAVFQLTNYPALEVLVIDNDSDEPSTLAYLQSLQATGKARVLHQPGAFNFAALNNAAARQANGACLCLLNNDVEPISREWLKEMVAHAMRPEIGAVGAMLYYPNNKIQHAGVLLDGIAAGHLYAGYPRNTAGYGNRARLTQNLSAITAACLVVRKSLWDEVGGMDEASFPVAFNDVDFCLRIASGGYRNLWTPLAELYHHESASRGNEDTPEKQARFRAEVEHLRLRWGKMLGCDPAWNPNLALDGARIRLADPPRLTRPWAGHGS